MGPQASKMVEVAGNLFAEYEAGVTGILPKCYAASRCGRIGCCPG